MILTIQRRMYEVGRIRIGKKVRTQSGKMAPSKIDTFRFTSQSELAINSIAELYGGEVALWKPDAKSAQQYEVVTPVKSLSVKVAPGQVLSQFMEMWGNAKCLRRCDGQIEQLSGENCLCPLDDDQRRAMAAQGKACKPTTRLSLMLEGVPVIGLWRIESHGFYAAAELGAMSNILEYATAAGVYIPATLRLDERPGPKGRIYVPVLELAASIAEITAALSLPQLGTGGHEPLLELPVSTGGPQAASGESGGTQAVASSEAGSVAGSTPASSAPLSPQAPKGYVDPQTGRIHVPADEPPLPGEEGHPEAVGSRPIEFEDDVEDAEVVEEKPATPVCICPDLDNEAPCDIHAMKKIGRGFKPKPKLREPIIDPVADNQLECGADGLYVPPTDVAITGIDKEPSAPAEATTPPPPEGTVTSSVQPEPEVVVAEEPAVAEMISPPQDGAVEAPGDGISSQTPGDGTFSQGIVIAAGKADIDDDLRHRLTSMITQGRTQSSKDVTPQESSELHNLFASIRLGRVELRFDEEGNPYVS